MTRPRLAPLPAVLYTPEPPLDAGTPRSAPSEVTSLIGGMFDGFFTEGRRVLRTSARPR